MGRVPYWNISYGMIIDLLAIPTFFLFFYGLYRYWIRIGYGKDRAPLGISCSAFKIGPLYLRAFLTKGILGTRIYGKLFTGIAHGCVFWGMALLFVGTVMVLLNVVVGLPVFEGRFNRWFMHYALNIAGIAVLCGILFLLIKRIFPSERLSAVRSRTSFVPMEIAIAFIIMSGFLLQGLRIAHTSSYEPGAIVGNCVAAAFGGIEGGLSLHRYLWWVHGLAALGFVAYIPFSPLVHLVLAPLNSGLSVPVPGPKMGNMDFSAFESEDAQEEPLLGAGKLADFSWKRLLDFAACVWCGRCHEVCPAAQTGKELSPKGIMMTLSELLRQEDRSDGLLTATISKEAIFNCTTCAACMEVCPISVNQPKAIMRLRQNVVMEQSDIPDTMGQALKSLEARQHPFFGTASGKRDWCKNLDVPIFEKDRTEYLLWIGCAATYEERAQKIGRAMVRILRHADVSFGILEEPRCTGDAAKQMGNEFLFQEIAQQNISDFLSLGVKKIITICPHCYNTFSRHYPQLGGVYAVIPHPIILNKLLSSGKISVWEDSRSIVYHDPCYLGRRNNILKEPRNAISWMGRLVEMRRNRSRSFCCGGGGGNYWAEETGERINQVRVKEALDTNADIIATSCPFCLLMMVDGAKKFTQEQKVFDIAELIDRQLQKGNP